MSFAARIRNHLLCAALGGAALALGGLTSAPVQAQSRQAIEAEMTPMQRAVHRKQPDELARLLASGADAAEFGIDGDTVLHLAAGAESDRYLRVLLDAGVNPSLPAKDGTSALVNALQAERHNHVQMLLKAGANPSQPDIVGKTPLHSAASMMDYEGVLILLQGGADPMARNKRGRTFQETLYPDPYVPLNARGRERLKKVTDWLEANGIALEKPEQ